MIGHHLTVANRCYKRVKRLQLFLQAIRMRFRLAASQTSMTRVRLM